MRHCADDIVRIHMEYTEHLSAVYAKRIGGQVGGDSYGRECSPHGRWTQSETENLGTWRSGLDKKAMCYDVENWNMVRAGL